VLRRARKAATLARVSAERPSDAMLRASRSSWASSGVSKLWSSRLRAAPSAAVDAAASSAATFAPASASASS